MSKRARSARAASSNEQPAASAYTGACIACEYERSCTACLATAKCANCTALGRCGSCRNIHSKAHRASGLQASVCGAGRGQRVASPRSALVPAVDALDLPRSRAGLSTYHRLVETTTPDLWNNGGGRWMYRPGSEFLAVEQLTPKDQYETPAHVWRHAVATYALDYDMHASSLNAVLPSYGTRAGTANALSARCATVARTYLCQVMFCGHVHSARTLMCACAAARRSILDQRRQQCDSATCKHAMTYVRM